MRSALALRTSLVTAVITGTLLVPAAAAAFAAAPQAVASTYGTVSDNSRYEGEPVYIGEGLVAVLRNKAEGPEAWIRAVGAGWKPGDNYMVKVVGLLNRTQSSDTVNGLELKLTKADTAAPVLTVTKAGVTKSYPLPKGEAGQSCDSAHKTLPIGAGVSAELSMSTSGPKAVIRGAGSDAVWRTLTRASSALPASDGIYLRIANASGAQPVLEWKTQGGDTPVGRAAFPALPKGCTPEYPVKDDTAAPAPKPATVSNTTTQTKGQTAVVPQGAVAAGAEITAEDGDNTTTLAAGAGLLAVFAALGAGVLRRRRGTV